MKLVGQYVLVMCGRMETEREKQHWHFPVLGLKYNISRTRHGFGSNIVT